MGCAKGCAEGIERGAEVSFPTEFGDFRLIPYIDRINKKCHLVLLKGSVKGVKETEGVLVRIHSQCLTGDVFRSLKCDCGAQLEKAMGMVSDNGSGAIVYLAQEGRGIGLANKIKAYALQDMGCDTVEANRLLGFKADERDYSFAAHILKDLGIRSIRLLTNNPDKINGLNGTIKVVERVPLLAGRNKNNKHYLETKKQKLGHIL